MSGVIARPRSKMTDALRAIQAPVRERLEDVTTAMQDIVTSGLPMVEEVSRHLLGMRGKMFRPTLTLLSSDLEGQAEPRAISLAAVIELMHLATLVHDDSVDHSATRRGLPTVNSMFSHQVSVIMGDYLYSRALRALVAIRDFDVLRVVTDVSNELSMGEMRQLAAIDALNFGEPEYELLIRAKTASLISAACESGALCGAARFRDAMARYGDRLGMAFQVVDDILDYTEDESVTGKPSGNDLREHKVTLPLIAALPSMSAAARRRVDELFASDEPSDAAIQDVMAIVAGAGGIDYARRRGEQYADEAEAALRAVPDSPARAALVDAIGYVTDRRW
ncbi:MAG TPA: polyprenyl synthetase family protein [Gemmatimonadaceae bacterium]|nr:polyprenyl synthetase family protein [Gemmatimonadaceae bacterium]